MNKKVNEKRQEYKITKKGSLALLAFGDIGLRAWRQVKNNKTDEKK